MDLTKVLALLLLIISFNANSIVPNDKYYEIADAQIAQLSSELKTIESSLELNPTHEISLQLKDNLNKEINLIKQRVELYKKLEKSGLIMYLNNQNSVSKHLTSN